MFQHHLGLCETLSLMLEYYKVSLKCFLKYPMCLRHGHPPNVLCHRATSCWYGVAARKHCASAMSVRLLRSRAELHVQYLSENTLRDWDFKSQLTQIFTMVARLHFGMMKADVKFQG